jgi:hypothetical protein
MPGELPLDRMILTTAQRGTSLSVLRRIAISIHKASSFPMRRPYRRRDHCLCKNDNSIFGYWRNDEALVFGNFSMGEAIFEHNRDVEVPKEVPKSIGMTIYDVAKALPKDLGLESIARTSDSSFKASSIAEGD